VWAPQRTINRAGQPSHPDLYANDIPTALAELGVRYVPYGRGRGYGPFARWARDALDHGDPVLAGVKILPSAHPDWGLDHFVLVVGYGDKGLLVNTTWGHRAWVSDTTTPGLSFKNPVYGLRLSGVRVPPNAVAARASLLEEGGDLVKLHVVCSGLDDGSTYLIERRGDRLDEAPSWSARATASGGVVSSDVTVAADRIARFACMPSLP
jgi:hypothetical protein